MTPEQAVALLAAAPARIDEAVSGASPKALRTRPSADEWSATEVLAHLRSCDEVWGAAVRAILADPGGVLRAVNPRTYVITTDYPRLAFAPSYAAFVSHRTALVGTLRALAPGDWELAVTVTGAGRPLAKTLWSCVERLTRHEQPHLRQLAAARR